MSKKFQVEEYVDLNYDKKWYVGKVVDKEATAYHIRLDGMPSIEILRVKFDSNRIAPIRSHTRGYTGQDDRTRDDPDLELNKLDEVFKLVEDFYSKDFDYFSAHEINSKLRGRIFLFNDNLFSKSNMNPTRIQDVLKYLIKYVELVVLYFKRFSDGLFSKFLEGLNDPEAIINQSDVAYSHFIFEALESLIHIFGISDHWHSAFDKTKFDETIFGEINSLYNDPHITQDPKKQNNGWSSKNNWDSEDIQEENKLTLKIMINDLLINRFTAAGGFKRLLNLINFEIPESKKIKDSMEIENEKKIALNQKSDLLLDQIISFMKKVSTKLQTQYLNKLLQQLVDKTFTYFQISLNQGSQDLDVNIHKDILDKLESFVLKGDDTKVKEYFFKNRETKELDLFLKLLNSSKLDKKLKGLSEIKRYKKRIEVSFDKIEDPWLFDNEEKELHYLDRFSFTKWLLDNKIIEIIHKKSQHVELIKRSIDLQIFIAKNNESFPQNIIDLIWESCQNSHGETLKVIYANIIELASYLKVEAALSLFSKITEVKIEDYDKDFIDLIYKYTEKCLAIVLCQSTNGLWKFKNENIEEKHQSSGFGIAKMFEAVMDDSPLCPDLSYLVLTHLIALLNKYPVMKMFLAFAKKCKTNIRENVSVCQSLIIMREFLSQLQNTKAMESACQPFYKRLVGKEEIPYLITSYESYWQSVRIKIKALKQSGKVDLTEEKYLEERFIGKFSHETNIIERIRAFKSYIVHPFDDSSLSFDQLKGLWERFVIKSNFDFEIRLFLETLSQKYQVDETKSTSLVSSKDMKKTLTDIILNKTFFNVKKLPIEKFRCLEFFFLSVNLSENKITRKEEEDNIKLTSSDVLIADPDLIGIDKVWDYLSEYTEKDFSQELIYFLVNLTTSLSPELKAQEHTVYQNTINMVMSSIENFLNQSNLPAIEKYVLFLSYFLDKLDNRENKENYDEFDSFIIKDPRNLLQVKVKFHPYDILKQFEFHASEKLGNIKIYLSKEFDIDIHEFDLMIDDLIITGNNLNDKLKDYFIEGTPITMLKKNDKDLPKSRYLLVENKANVEIYFQLFSAFESDKLKTVWSFFQTLPIQEDLKKEFSKQTDFSRIINEKNKILQSNILKLHYYLSIIQELVVVDPYYWKMPKINYRLVKSKWASKFVYGKGMESLVNFILNTDFQQISNFLFLKTLVLLCNTLNFFFISFEETKSHWNEKFFFKTLDILLYSTKYVVAEFSMMEPQQDVIKNYGLLFDTISGLLQNMIKVKKDLCKKFLAYPNLKEIYLEIFVNLSSGDQPKFLEIQNSFIVFMNVILETLKNFPEKELRNELFNILFGHTTFAAIESPKPAAVILKFIAEFWRKEDLKKQFDNSEEISQFIARIIEYIAKYEPSSNIAKESKLEACFFILYRYLENNTDKLDQFGTGEGLANEILVKGIFKGPFQSFKEKPKYQSKSVVAIAFQLLCLLCRGEKNLALVINFLLPIHQESVWRNNKFSSWSLTSNIKRRVFPYAGLKNLGCSKFTFLSFYNCLIKACYMNSTLQQLFMIPSFSKAFAKLEDPNFKAEEADSNMLFQMKRLFYGMTHTIKEFFSPKKFCLSFKDIDGNPTSFREQKDAFEFLTLLLDRLEEKVKQTNHEDFVKNLFGGNYSSEIICKDCPHYYEREEPFLGVNLIVKGKKNIQESLKSFVEGQTLADDNAYECEKCKAKVRAVKRVSFKNLPNYLIFVLNRFEYDFEKNMRIKINDYYEFSQNLDMGPYTQQNIKENEKEDPFNEKHFHELSRTKSITDFQEKQKYELRGVVVHVGVADSGHYYSIIKDREINKEKKMEPLWIEFNDTHVSEFDMKKFPNVAYGNSYGSSTQSAYILVYERKSIAKEEENPKRKVVNAKDSKSSQESSMIVEEEVSQTNFKEAELKYIKMFHKEVAQKNKKLFYIERLFSEDYIKFLFDVVKIYEEKLKEHDLEMKDNTNGKAANKDRTNKSIQQLFRFIWVAYCTTFLRSNDVNLQQSFFEWIYAQIESNATLYKSLLGFFSHSSFFTEMILQCPKQHPRKLLISIAKKVFRKIFLLEKKNGTLLVKNDRDIPVSAAITFLSFLINILPQTKFYLRSLEEYFELWRYLLQIDEEVVGFVLSKRMIGRLLNYFQNNNSDSLKSKEIFEKLEAYEMEIKIRYDTELLDDPRKDSERDFENPDLVNLNKFFAVLWQLLQYSAMPERESYDKFLYHKKGVNYMLSKIETKLLDLHQAKIRKMFSYVNRNDKKARTTVCKIIAFTSFGSLEDSRICFEFVENGLKEDMNDKLLEECFELIRVLAKIQDFFQQERNKILLEYIVSAIAKRSKNIFEMNTFVRFLKKLVSTNDSLEATLKKNSSLLVKVIAILREVIMQDSDVSEKPSNHQVTDHMKKLLGKLKDYFSELKMGKITESMKDLETASEADETLESKYRKGQAVKFYDDTGKKDIKGKVENVYEDFVKVKVISADGSVTYKWFDEASNLRLDGNLEVD